MRTDEKATPASTEPAAQAPAMQQEADIGSGEKTPGEHETDEMIKSIPPLPGKGAPDKDETKN